MDISLPLIADVALDRSGRDAYSYRVNDDLAPQLRVGDCVTVPFGPRRERGFVVALERRAPPPGITLKEVLGRQDGVRLPAHLLDLIRWAAAYYRCDLGTLIAAAVPTAVRQGTKARRERFIARLPHCEQKLTARQREILAVLPLEPLALAAACSRAGCHVSTLERLAAAGAALIRETTTVREVRLTAAVERFPPTAEQQAAITAVAACLPDQHAVFLLYGVTGSGKTLVYMELAEQVIASGRQVLLLLPEIGLTPQLAARFRQRFARVVIWHSAFSQGERALQWHQVATGAVDLVIGTRSALFAPLPRPGLIVVDEEHDQSFKQDSEPRYQGRDLAVVYARQLGIPVILGSATPSLETYHNARQGRYQVLTLLKRPAGGRLPQARVIDMRTECRRQGRQALISQALLDGLKTCQAAGQQSIVLLNRRGWSPVVSCLACGVQLHCEHCDISLTYHRQDERLRCHYCGYERTMPQHCPTCGETGLSTRGIGTEQLADTLAAAVPGLRVIRVDADTVANRQAHAALLRSFAEGSADCMVGTQMVAKGLDFPRVTLVGIVGADQGLGVPDFRAGERTFQLIAQVAGRAGRGQDPGTVIVQAFDPQALAVRYALDQRLKSFYTHELAIRQRYGYPPHGGLLRLVWRGPEAAIVAAVAEEDGAALRGVLDDAILLGPGPAGMPFLQGQHRWHALIKTASRGLAQRFLDRLLKTEPKRKRRGVTLIIDVDPYAIQ